MSPLEMDVHQKVLHGDVSWLPDGYSGTSAKAFADADGWNGGRIEALEASFEAILERFDELETRKEKIGRTLELLVKALEVR